MATGRAQLEGWKSSGAHVGGMQPRDDGNGAGLEVLSKGSERELEVYPGFVISQLSRVVNDRHDGAGRESPDGQRSEGRAGMYPVL